MQRYAGTPLAKSPEGVRYANHVRGRSALAIFFVRFRQDLPAEVATATTSVSKRHRPEFNKNDVRNAGLAAGLVDYKVCSVNAQWSGIKFARKKTR